jgi:hypothetical protein
MDPNGPHKADEQCVSRRGPHLRVAEESGAQPDIARCGVRRWVCHRADSTTPGEG